MIALVLASTAAAVRHPPVQISADTYTNATSQHATQPEPESYAWGNTLVAVVQTGRFFDGGASNVAWSTSTDGGATWTTGNLPGTTIYQGGPWARVSDPSVAYDAMHDVWLAQTLGLDASPTGRAVIVNRSTNGGLTWGNPTTIAQTATNFFDKNWIACDNYASSPFYGTCYAEWDDSTLGNRLLMSRSTDGGLTWGSALAPAGLPSGLGGQPVALPNGTVVVPYTANYGSIGAFRSTDGGASWSSSVFVATQSQHSVAG
ncbi:MAG TPA: sialidase family protein, partial [Gaiellaceae bacterium]|nr:sialidase family protein [Gaiellaceae bacterium]